MDSPKSDHSLSTHYELVMFPANGQVPSVVKMCTDDLESEIFAEWATRKTPNLGVRRSVLNGLTFVAVFSNSDLQCYYVVNRSWQVLTRNLEVQ